MDQKFSLRWKNYLNEMTSSFDSLRNEEDLVDVTLSCEGKKLKAHKILLSACSSYFQGIFKENPCHHPVIVFRNVKYLDLEALVDFMYKGETNIIQEQLESFLDTAALLEVRGLTDGSVRNNGLEIEENAAVLKSWPTHAQELAEETKPVLQRNHQPPIPPIKKRKLSSLTTCAKPPEKKLTPALNEVSVDLLPGEGQESFTDPKYSEEVTGVGSTRDKSLQPLPNRYKPDSSLELSMNIKSPQDQRNNSLPILGGCIDEPMEEEVDSENQINNTVEEDLGTLSEPVAVVDSSASDNVSVNYLEENKSTSFSADFKYEVESNIVSASLETPSHASKLEKNKCITSNPLSNSKGCIHLTPSTEPVTKPSYGQHSVNMNLEYQQDIESDEDYSALTSEEAKAPYHDTESQSHSDQQLEVPAITNVTGQIDDTVEADVPKEEPEIDCEQTTAKEEEKEPQSNNFGCEICKSEVKPMDGLNFFHKCPICPCTTSCSHLLKEHMKYFHGWFNVQRRFNPY